MLLIEENLRNVINKNLILAYNVGMLQVVNF